MSERELVYGDLERAREAQDPEFAALVMRYLEQDDPPEDRPELPEGVEPEKEPVALPRDAWTVRKLKQATNPSQFWGHTDDEAKTIRQEAWRSLEAAQYPPPRLRLGSMLLELYEDGSDFSRNALLQIFLRGRICWGMWQGMKRIYKLAEERHDAQIFGALAYRFDAVHYTDFAAGEVRPTTFSYLKRRAWRYLLHLGQAVPELFPTFACEVLKHYGADMYIGSAWIPKRVYGYEDIKGGGWLSGLPDKLEKRACHESWKQSAAPLLTLLEEAKNDTICEFAIRCLEKDFPDTLRDVDASWLTRLGAKPLASVHTFVVKLLAENPSMASSKLKGLGLEPMVLDFLFSDSDKATAYAVKYVQDHVAKVDPGLLSRMVVDGRGKVLELGKARLSASDAKQLGFARLVRIFCASSAQDIAKKKIAEGGFGTKDVTVELFVELIDSGEHKFVDDFYKEHKAEIPTTHYCELAERTTNSWGTRRYLRPRLRKRSDIDFEWAKRAIVEPKLAANIGSNTATRWVTDGLFAPEVIDVDWIKRLVRRPNYRNFALEVLGNLKLVKPGQIGLPFLLSLARAVDEQRAQFARRYLLEHFQPADFASTGGDLNAGVERLFHLASAANEPESVRAFAASYLQVHHPELAKHSDEARELGIKPKLKAADYTAERVLPLLSDPRQDVRRLGKILVTEHLLGWSRPEVAYELAESRFREGRSVGAWALLSIGEEGEQAPPPSWLVPERVFALAESGVKATREICLSLIRRHYQSIGGASRLVWLMESPDRDVRLAAARLLWEKHRPSANDSAGRFETLDALRDYLRTMLFGLPPGRMERRDAPMDGVTPDRALPASEAKRRVIGVVRDLGVEDAAFAQLIVPILSDFATSRAKGEWHGCVSALASIRRRHPQLTDDMGILPAPRPDTVVKQGAVDG